MIIHETRRGEYIATINHELRTPLNAILGFSDLLIDGEGLDVRQRRYVENIRSSGHRLLCLVDSIIGMATAAREVRRTELGMSWDRPQEQGGEA